MTGPASADELGCLRGAALLSSPPPQQGADPFAASGSAPAGRAAPFPPMLATTNPFSSNAYKANQRSVSGSPTSGSLVSLHSLDSQRRDGGRCACAIIRWGIDRLDDLVSPESRVFTFLTTSKRPFDRTRAGKGSEVASTVHLLSE